MRHGKAYRPYAGRRGVPLWAKLLGLVLALAVAAFALLEGAVLAGAHTRIAGEPEVLVVLGTRMYDTGPSVLLRDRLDTAAAYLEGRADLPVIVAGGQGADEPVSEAEGMRDYLVALGIGEERIWMENASHSTSENLLNTKRLLEEKGMDPAQTRLLVVSNGFHLTRVRLLAERYGLRADTLAAPSSDAWGRVVLSCLREAPALVKSFLFD